MSSIAKVMMIITLLSPSLFLFFMSVVYGYVPNIPQIGMAIVFFLITFLVKG